MRFEVSSVPFLARFFRFHLVQCPKTNRSVKWSRWLPAVILRSVRTGLASIRSLFPVSNKQCRRCRCCLNFSSKISSITPMLTSNQSRRWRRWRRDASSRAARAVGSCRMRSARWGCLSRNLRAWNTVKTSMIITLLLDVLDSRCSAVGYLLSWKFIGEGAKFVNLERRARESVFALAVYSCNSLVVWFIDIVETNWPRRLCFM